MERYGIFACVAHVTTSFATFRPAIIII